MSKKIFLERSFSSVVKGVGENNVEKEVMVVNSGDSWSDGEPGESVITPGLQCFSYKDITKTIDRESLPNPRKRKRSNIKKVKPAIIVLSDSSSDESLPQIYPPKRAIQRYVFPFFHKI